jgi:hypothetical protein
MLTETPMSPTCREVPTIEECQAEAGFIEDPCLKNCVLKQCSGAKVVCNEHVQQKCQFLNQQKGSKIGGYVERKEQDCLIPKDEIGWCQIPMSRQCRTKAMVHELAHSCGWKHGEGHGIPGNNGRLQCI